MEDKVQSDFLFARPSFGSGAARVLDLWGRFDGYNGSATGDEADWTAIASDWTAVGQDILKAIDQFESEIEAA